MFRARLSPRGLSVERLAAYSIILLMVATLYYAFLVSSAAGEDLQPIFRKYCGACHRGRIAPNWSGTIAKIKSWAEKYATLDEAVRAEYHFRGKGANSYDDLMSQMKSFSAGISDEVFKKLYEFFKNVFLEAKGGAASPTATAPPATTVTVTVTVTTTPIATTTKTVTVERTVTLYEKQEAGSFIVDSLLALAAIVVVVGGLAFFLIRQSKA